MTLRDEIPPQPASPLTSGIRVARAADWRPRLAILTFLQDNITFTSQNLGEGRLMRLRGIAVLLFAAMPAIVAAQAPAAATLSITGAVERPLTLTVADLAKMPRASVEVRSRQGTVTYTGVLLFEVLKLAGAPVGERLRGPYLASYVVAEARDGYRVLFSLPEIDPGFTDAKVLVADHANGKELGGERGPFRLVPADKSAHRAVRMLQRLEVATLPK